jgi:hypothetical protein
MRVLAISLIATFVFGLAVACVAAPAPSTPTVAATTAQPASQPAMARNIKLVANAYRSHRAEFARVSDYSERVRSNWIAGLVAFAIFVLLTVPASTRGIGAFYHQMMEPEPLAMAEGVTEDNNRQARKVLFFYLLFLLYQLIEYPLTLGHSNGVPFVADLLIQTCLVIAVAWSYHGLKRGMHRQWKDDPARQQKTDRWLGQRLDGMRIRWRDIRGLAVVVFIVEFAPVFLSHLTGWLDVLAAHGEKLIGS